MLCNLGLGYAFNLISCLPHIPSATLGARVPGHPKLLSTSELAVPSSRNALPLGPHGQPPALCTQVFIQMSCPQRGHP